MIDPNRERLTEGTTKGASKEPPTTPRPKGTPSSQKPKAKMDITFDPPYVLDSDRCCLTCAWGHDWKEFECSEDNTFIGRCRYPIPPIPDSFLEDCEVAHRKCRMLSYQGTKCLCWLDKKSQAQANVAIAARNDSC